jgi:predicted deacylase
MNDGTIVFPAPGRMERRQLAFAAPALAEYQWPYFAISGAQDGPTVCVIGGIHGAEYPPIDAVMRFCRELDPVVLCGRVIGVPVVNLPAFRARAPFVCPPDGKNLNRVFPGKEDGTFSEVLAYHFFRTVIQQADCLIDLHGGDLVEDLVPFSLMHRCGRADVDGPAQALAVAFGLPYVVVEGPAGGPVSGSTDVAAAAAGIPAVIAEAGGIGQLTPAAVNLHRRGLRRVLQHLKMLPGTPAPEPNQTIVRGLQWVLAGKGGFFRKAVVAGDSLRRGDSIGEMVDLWGEPVDTVVTPVDGVVLFVTTSPAVADNGLLVGIGMPEA